VFDIRKIVFRIFAYCSILIITLGAHPTTVGTDGVFASEGTTSDYHLEFDKSDRILRLKRGRQIHREFTAASGSGGVGDKTKTGDKQTPEGIYRIAGFNEKSKFHLFMRLNYPNVKDAFYGLKNDIISRNEFDRIVDSLKLGRLPPQNTALGGAIGIHGVGFETEKKLRIHSNMDWTDGCIALTNDDVSELRTYVRVGTEVVIRE
jgi:murein L,D-transpeptidase YafK